MIPLHEAAQSVGWFAIMVIVGIAVILARDIRKERKEDDDKKL